MLLTVGDLVEDVVVWLDRPIAHASDTPAHITRARGGSAANVAVFAAATGSGVPVRFVGQIGDDGLGSLLCGDLVRAGVEPCVVRSGRTGSIVVLVEPGGERTMLPDRGTSPLLAAIDPAWLDGVALVHVPSYSLFEGPLAEAVVSAFAADAPCRCRSTVRLSVDVSAYSLVEEYGVERYRTLLEERLRPDIVLANAEEAAAVDLVRRPIGLTVIKRGPEPVLLRGEASGEVPVPPVEVLDSTGAGDAFAAGFLTALLTGAEPISAARAGNALAARVLRSPGATLAPPA